MEEIQKINVNVDFIGPLIVVKNLETAQAFYEQCVGQKLKFDFGAFRQFESGLTIQSEAAMTDGSENREKNTEQGNGRLTLYFETDDFDAFIQNLKAHDLEYMRAAGEYERGRRSVRFYDLDDHLVDVSEKTESAVKRFAAQGMPEEEIVKRTRCPAEFVRFCLK